MNRRRNGTGTGSGATHTLYTIFVPLNQNNGHPQAPEHFTWVQQTILDQAGGLTCFAPSQGFWIGGNHTTFVDQILPIQVLVPDCAETDAWFMQLAAELALRLEQQEIFLWSQPIWLLEPHCIQGRKGAHRNGRKP